MDLGLLHFATLSDGSTIENPRHLRQAEQKLKKLQEALSRKKRGSKRRRKAAQRVGKTHRHIRNQRKDFHHKEARKLVTQYQTIVFEKLAPSNMSKRPKPKQDEATGHYLPNGASAKAGLNKSIHDAGWGQFQQICASKAECAGSHVLFVSPKYTSQMCSACGAIAQKELDERWHSCSCGTELDRDHNAAMNILRNGLSDELIRRKRKTTPQARTEPSEDAPLRSPGFSRGESSPLMSYSARDKESNHDCQYSGRSRSTSGRLCHYTYRRLWYSYLRSRHDVKSPGRSWLRGVSLHTFLCARRWNGTLWFLQ